MYSDELRKLKIRQYRNEMPAARARVSDEILEKLIDEFCTVDDLVGVPQPDLFRCFDEFCESKGIIPENHIRTGRIFKRHFKVARKKVRKDDGNLCWVYVPTL